MEPSAMRWYHPLRRARILTIAAVIVTTSVSAFGQTGQPLLSAAAQAAAQSLTQPESGGPVRRLAIDDAVKLALEQNLGIRIQRIDPQIQDVGISQARSFWAPSVSTTFSRQTQTQASTSSLAGSATSITNGNFATGLNLNQTLPWGGSYISNWNNSRFTTTNLFSTYSPQLASNVNFQYTQPLLRNFSVDAIRQQVAFSKKTRDLSDIQLDSVIVSTTRAVKNAYWDLSYAINNLKAQQESLALAQQSLKDTRKRVEIR